MKNINEIYQRLESECIEIYTQLNAFNLHLEWGWYNGHYHKADNGEWEREFYPIPVITIKSLCDIEIGIDNISISTKLRREHAVQYSFSKFESYTFEAYGVENYLEDFYTSGESLLTMKAKILESNETEIGFSFYFSKDGTKSSIKDVIQLLIDEEFYY